MEEARSLIEALDAGVASGCGIRFIAGEREETYLSYRQLREQALLLLGDLQEAGLTPGDEVVFQLEDNRSFLLLFWACLLGGLVPVPLAVASSDERRLKVANVCRVLRRPLLVGTEAGLAQLAQLGEVPGVCALAWEDLGRSSRPAEPRPAAPDDLAYVQFSSGSTGQPKGVELTHGNLAANTADIAHLFALTPEDSLLSWMPLTHDLGLIGFHLTGVLAGVHQHLMPAQLFVRRPMLWLQKASEHRAKVLFSPNFGLHYFLSAFRPEAAAGWDLSRARICDGAEPISAEVCRRFTAALAPWGLSPHAIFPSYGLAEACVGVTAQPPGEPLVVHGVDRRSLQVGSRVAEIADGPHRLELVECGAPLRSVRVRVCDDEGRELDEGRVGHVEIHGPNVTRGYYADPEATRRALSPEGWLRTGDLGFLRQGRLVVAGRAKDLILAGGRNFYPHDLERLAEAAGGLEAGKTAACALPEPADGREVAALFVQWKGPLAELAPLADRIADHVLREAGLELAHVVPVRRLPRTTSGKIQRHRLVESWRAGEFAAQTAELAALRRPAPSIGGRLPELLALVEAEARRISGAPRIDPDRPLGEQGFDSQKAVALTTALGRALGAELPAALVFDHPSPRALARFLAGEEDAPQAPSSGAVHDEPIAVIGLGCRFPGGGDGPESFWRLLAEGTDAVREIPAERWDAAAWYDPDPDAAGKMVIRHGGFLDAIDRFDNGFFAVSAPEAEALDPQQRLLLEVSWEALEHAGLDVARLAGSRAGVFVGLCGAEYARQHLHSGDPARIDAYSLTGVALSTAAGRLSYVYGFRGPCLTVDTACSSSLAAVHLAVRSLRSGESALALAGGVNLILGPEVHVGFSRLHAMARDGRCKTFDAAADGYARSEGCGLVVLKRLSDARAAGDRVLAVIRGSAMNQDGTTHGLTAPSGVAQQEVIRLALADAEAVPAAVQYVEAHGTGTPLGDPQEMAALAAVYGQDRPAAEPLLVGSVKTNLGHTEAAAGVAALLKVVLALAHETIPRHLHFATPSPRIPWDAIPVRVPAEPAPWPRGGRPRRAGVSSFGFSGTNVHLVVEEAPAADPAPAAERRVHVLPVSARSREALKGLLAGYRQRLSEDGADLGALCFTAAVRRTHHPFRAALVGTSRRDLVEQIDLLDQEGYAAGPAASGWGEGEPPGTVFLFPGQGSQWPGMALDLLRHEPVFRRAMEECEAALAPHTGWRLLSELAGDGCAAFLSQIDQVQPALFAVQVALAGLWTSWGIVPHALVGQSMGEVAAARVAGALSLDDAARIICRRSRLLRRISGRGAMLAVELPLEEAEEAIRGHEDRVAIAVGSGPRSTVLSGDPAALDEVAAALGRRQVFCRLVKVDVASHSPQVDVLGDDLLRELEGIEPRPARIPMVSTVTGRVLAGEELDAAYWWSNLRRPVLFAGAVSGLLQRGHRFFLEMSPHPLLLPSVEQCIEHAGRVGEAHAVASVWRDLPEQTEILGNLGLLYTRGYPVPWRRLYGDASPWAELPPYPWQRSRFWIDAPARSLAPGTHPLLGPRLDAAGSGLRFWESEIDLRRLPWLADHRVEEAVVFPAAGWLAMVAAACRQLYGEAAEVLDAEFVAPLALEEEPRRVQLRIEDGHRARFEIWSAGELRARGALRRGGAEPVAPVAPRPVGRLRSGEEHYRGLERRGLRYGPRFRAVREIWVGEREALARVVADPALHAPSGELHPALLDACLQAFAGAARRGTWLPAGLRRLAWYGPPDTELWASASWRETDYGIEGDLRVTGRDGEAVLVAEGVRLAPLSRDTEEPLLQLTWREADPAAQLLSPEGSWGVLGGALAGEVQGRLEAAGVRVVPLEEATGGVFYVPDLPDEPDPDRIEAEVLRLARLIQKLPLLVLVTRGAVATEDGAAVLPGQAALWGLGKVIAEEHPELACTRLDLPVEPDAADLDRLAGGWPAAEPESAVRGGAWLLPRLVPLEAPRAEPAAGRPFAAFVRRPGDLDGVALRALSRRDPGPGEVEVEVAAAGLNFMNVLSALGLYPGAPGGFRTLGVECAGRVVRTGPGARRLRPGDEVLGLSFDCLASHALAREELLAVKPGELSFAAAATVPVAFLTALYGLQEVARLAAGERVLIHSAAGGVGLAAVQVARRLGAEVLATAGTEEKRELLRWMGIRHVFDSRSLEFADAVLSATGGRGVDVVLNSLAGEAMRRSLALLAPFGRFVEIGKRDLHGGARIDLGLLRQGASYTAVDLDRLAEERPALLGRLLAETVDGIAAGELAPLPLEEHSLTRPAAAFHRMAQGAHVGKIVLLRREDEEAQLESRSGPPALDRNGTYLVTGGYGALGLIFAAWLLDRGAGVVALLGRSGPSLLAAERMAEIERRHGPGRLALLRGDVADEASLARSLAEAERRLPPLRGVLHAAGVLEDRSLLQLDGESCRRVLAPKVRGAWNLHRLTAGKDLHLFVLFASAAGLLGSAGQASYAAGNAFLDGLARYRRSRGLPALAMDWGPVAEIGLAAARDDRGRRLAEEGVRSLAPEECPVLLEAALARGMAQAGAIDLAGLVSALPLLAEVCAAAAPASGVTPLRQRLAALPSDAGRLELLGAHLAEQVARVVRCPVETLAVDTPFKGLGLDSLLALQLAKRLGESLGLTVPVTSFWTYPTLLAYRGFLAAQLGFGAPAAPPPPVDDAVARELDELSEEEAERRLLEKLAAAPELSAAGVKSKVHETM